MKTNKILSFILMLVVAVTMTSCVQDDDYTVPNSLGEEENAKLNTLLAQIESGAVTLLSIAEVKAEYQDENIPKFVETNIAVRGYVSSSDQTGNFFKEIFLQDSPDSPTTGIKIIMNQVDSYNQYNVGREVYISLKGLYIGEERVGNEVITIGGGTETDQFGTTVTRLTENQRAVTMFRSENTFEILPLVKSFSEISKDDIGVFVKFENVEFADNLDGLRYFDPLQDFDTQRIIQVCGDLGFYEYFILETSSFASFANELLPVKNGSISGVITKDFTGSNLLIALNGTDDVDLTNDRCNLIPPIISEDFESAVNNTNLDFPGWTNFNQTGNFKWREKIFDNNGYAEFSTFNSGNPSNIGWLITPGINMDAQENEILNFKAAQHHLDSANNTLEVFVSTDYNGTNVLAANWEPISAILPTMDNEWYEFVDSGSIDLSSYSGTLYVAFKVTGSGTDLTLDGAYQIDNFVIYSE